MIFTGARSRFRLRDCRSRSSSGSAENFIQPGSYTRYEIDSNDAYSGRTVSLQLRAKGAETFQTVKKATTSSTGGLKATVTASVDGYYRWVYYGNSTTGVATSAADYIDVR